MKRANGTCNQPGCPSVPVYRGRCHEHAEWNPNPDRQRGRALMTRRRRLIRQAFGRCTRCGGPGPLELHHLDGDPSNDAPTNLQPRCITCHREATLEQAYARLHPGIDSPPP